MKNFIFTTLAISLVSTLAFAQSVNPGVDPNLAKSSKSTEADVGNVGVCRECVARMKHNRLSDDTTYRPSKDSDKKSESAKGTQ